MPAMIASNGASLIKTVKRRSRSADRAALQSEFYGQCLVNGLARADTNDNDRDRLMPHFVDDAKSFGAK